MPYIGGSEIKYSLFLFDEQLPDMTGAELAQFTHSLWHRQKTPILIVQKSDDFDSLVKTIIRAIHH
jgi:DNA-binding response OmpR family regulator